MTHTTDYQTLASGIEVWPKLVNATTQGTYTLVYPGGQVINITETPEMRHKKAALAQLQTLIRAGQLKPYESIKRRLEEAKDEYFKAMKTSMESFGLGVVWARTKNGGMAPRPVVIHDHPAHQHLTQQAAA